MANDAKRTGADANADGQPSMPANAASVDAAPSPEPAAQAEQWLDGLAGRTGAGAAHAQGRQVREALLPDDTAALPPWEQIVQRAAAQPQAADASITPIQHDSRRLAQPAANQPRWRPWYALAASVVLAVTVVVALQPGPDEVGMRGVGGQPTTTAVWRVAQPQEAAAALAADLRALGAAVELQGSGQQVMLLIEAPAATTNAINQRLAALESTLDAQGRLSLRVLPP